ncbi:MAG: hypothetical protein K8S56_03050, partial [Candidatus Cloacimonetes bacterium]|nr:hypothetical protein [Candidatus Cloacimonadota bacterium]
MNRIVLLALVLVFAVASISSEVYTDNFFLGNYPHVSEDKIKATNYPVTDQYGQYQYLFLSKLNLTTEWYEDSLGVEMRSLFFDHPFGYSRFMTREEAFARSFESKFRQIMREKTQTLLRETDRDSGLGIFGGEFTIPLPRIAMPRAVQLFMGDKAARLSIDGSQKLTLSLTQTEKENFYVAEEGTRKDYDFNMLQVLSLRLRGQIGEKIHVNVIHNSTNTTSLGDNNTIEIKYVGNEDEIIQSIEGGNISLSLTGSRYIGYSASSEGLFGIKSKLKFGSLEITTIVGKEEGEKSTQRYEGNTTSDSITVHSKDFAPRNYYYLIPPEELYAIYGKDIALDSHLPASYANNAIYTIDGSWVIPESNVYKLPEKGSVRVYLDDYDYLNDQISTIEGHAWRNPTWDPNSAVDTRLYKFEELIYGTDFVVDDEMGILILQRTITSQYSIGIIYQQRDGTMVGNPDESDLRVKMLRSNTQEYIAPDNVNYDTSTWKYQMRNVYQNYNLQNVQIEGFKFNIYIENEDKSFNFMVPEDIIKADGSPWSGEYIDYLKMDSNGDNSVNPDDKTIDKGQGIIIMPFIHPFWHLGDSLIYKQTSINYDDFNISMYYTGAIGQDQISLNQMNILKGSVKVTVNGETLSENADYVVDYDFGNITFLTTKGQDADAKIVIDFEYKPLFAIDSKTMAGVRADMKFTDQISLGGTFVYHSETVSDERPKIGNENKIQMMGDIDGKITLDPPFMTKLVNWIPFIKTDTESMIDLSGEVAVNIPKIYGKASDKDDPEAWVEDMEAIINIFPLGISRPTWRPASQPYGSSLGKAKINWFNPTDIYAEDVYDSDLLTTDEESEKVQVMRMKIVPPAIQNPGMKTKYWAGLMKYVGYQTDMSNKEYIEVLIRADSTNTPVNVHINMGSISENFYNGPGGLSSPDTEDVNMDGSLNDGEDTGLDGIPDSGAGDDPYDNYNKDKDSATGDYPGINGTEGNMLLDSEDLDENGSLDLTDSYFEYS